jgi:drug/metabolite transporter (DMT)-like permease
MPPVIHRTMTAGEWSLLGLLAVLWGGSYFYVGVAIKVLSPLEIVAFRVTLGALLLYLVVRVTGAKMPRDRDTWGAFFVMGVTNNVIPFNLIGWAQSHVASGLAAILNATTPLFAVVLAHHLTHDERMTPARVVGVVIGFGGVVVMIGPDAVAGATTNLLADLALLLAAVFYALSPIYGRRFGRAGLPALVAATGQFTASAVIMIPLALIIDHPWTLPMPGAEVWGALFGLGALSGSLAYIIYYRLLATAGAVNLILVTFLVPVTAILLGALFLDEHLAVNHFLGMACIGLGLAAIDGRIFRVLRTRRA